MELQAYIGLVRRWLWLMLIAMVVGAGLSFVTTSRQVPIYRTQATVMIGQYMQSPNPNYAEIRTGMDLAATYVELIRTRPVLQAAADALELDIPGELLGSYIETAVVDNTSLIVITVTDSDPVFAADLANAVAEALVSQSPTNLTVEQEAQVAFLNDQIAILNTQVQELRQRLQEINTRIAASTDTNEQVGLQQERDIALSQLNEATGNIAQFSSTIAQLQERANSIQIVEEAVPSRVSITVNRSAPVLLYALAAGALALVAGFLFEYLDDTIRNPEDATQMLALPVLGSIVRFGTRQQNYKDMLLVRFPPMSSVNESYRSARTNILHALDKDKTGVLIITSASPQEGKTVTSSNLAISMAMSGLRVVLIDADLRRPRLHEAFSLENKIGLTTLLFADPGETEERDESSDFPSMPKSFSQCVQPSGIDKLTILTSGFIPSNPTELLASTAMAHWIDTMCSSPDIDLVIIDSPPTLAAADASVLASNLGAKVALVVASGSTRFASAKRAKMTFTQLNITPIGIIINRMSQRRDQYGYYYGYYYTTDSEVEAQPPLLQRLFRSRQPRA